MASNLVVYQMLCNNILVLISMHEIPMVCLYVISMFLESKQLDESLKSQKTEIEVW